MFFQAAVAGPKLHPFSTWSMLVRFFQICWCSIELKTVTLSSTCFLVHPEVNKISLCLLKKIFRRNPAFVATTSHRLHVHTKVFELFFLHSPPKLNLVTLVSLNKPQYLFTAPGSDATAALRLRVCAGFVDVPKFPRGNVVRARFVARGLEACFR